MASNESMLWSGETSPAPFLEGLNETNALLGLPTVNPLMSMMVTTAMPHVIEDHPYIVYAREVYVWLIPFMIAILSVAILGNGIIVISSPYLVAPVSPYLRMCVSLAAADMWAASLLIAGLIGNSYMPVVMRVKKSNECVSAVLEIFRISGMLTSDLHIFALAVNQFIGIMWPLKYKMMITTRRMRLLILALWAVPIGFLCAWFFALPDDGLRHPKCVFMFYSKLPFRLTIFLLFVVPLLATYALYVIILSTLLKVKAKCDINVNIRRIGHSTYRNRVQSKLKLVWTTLLILGTFTLSWGLCVLYFALVCVDGCVFIYRKSVSFYMGFFLNSSVNSLVMIKLAINPCIYAFRIRHIRSSILSLFRVICRRRDPSPYRPSISLTASTHAGFAAIQVTGYGYADDARRTNPENSQDDFLLDLHCPLTTQRHKTSLPLRQIEMNDHCEDLSLLSGIRRKKRDKSIQNQRV
uniref:G_PROTEIN_RECEP_F1_2 domain-containing protein n=1 Tax=Steinernema glaseri TaxID=37863 RepID=A0A1I7YEX7_9BILA